MSLRSTPVALPRPNTRWRRRRTWLRPRGPDERRYVVRAPAVLVRAGTIIDARWIEIIDGAFLGGGGLSGLSSGSTRGATDNHFWGSIKSGRTSRCSSDRSVPTLSIGERERSSIDKPSRCQPAGVRRSRPARSSDSSASPRRSLWTERQSRSLARVSTRTVGQKIKALLIETASPFRPELGNELQMGRLHASPDQIQLDRRRCRCRTVLVGEDLMSPYR